MVAVLVLIITVAQPEAIGQESTRLAPQEFEIESGKHWDTSGVPIDGVILC